jgi:hypothetical protein
MADALERMATADEHRNELLVADATERRASWAESEARQERALAQLHVSPVDWLTDPDYDRLYWAIARARGRSGGSTSDDEAFGQAIIAELRGMV